jgi:hypothetical protein
MSLLATGVGAQGLDWSTLMGGSLRDAAYAVAVDAAGLVTVAGRTESADWPYGPANGANADVFVARLDPRLSGRAQLKWCTMLDGGGVDIAFDLAMSVDGGLVTVVGLTSSPGLRVTPNAYQPALRGPADAFVMQLDGTGAITYLSYLGGLGYDWANAVEHGPRGLLVIAGVTDSGSFPTTRVAYDTTFNGATDMFVSVLDPRQPPASQLAASTFLGGGSYEGVPFNLNTILNMSIGEVAIDFDGMDGSILVAGRTASTPIAPFPTTAGAFQTSYAGGRYADAFVSRLDFTLQNLLYSTYLGGTGDDAAMKLAIHPSGDVCIAGFTWSPDLWQVQFPTTAGAPRRTLSGQTDGVVAALRTEGRGASDLRYSTLVGGPSGDWLFTLLVEDSGVITAAGTSEGGFPGTPGSLQPISSPPRDNLLVRVDPRNGGNADLHYVSFFGGLGGVEEFAIGLARHGDGLVTVAGISDAALPTRGALQPQPNGLLEAFVSTIDLLPADTRRIGRSTPGCRGPVWLQVNSNPAPGNTAFEVIGNGAPLRQPGAFVLGTTLLSPPLQILNAQLHVVPALVLPDMSDQHGAWRRPLALPSTLPPPTTVYLQWFFLESASCAIGPLSASHGLGI